MARKQDVTEAGKAAYLTGVEEGIRHLRQLGLAHNNINPSNVDSTRPIGGKLGSKAGTFEWELEGQSCLPREMACLV